MKNPLSNLKPPNSKQKSDFLYALRYNVGENISKGVDLIPKVLLGGRLYRVCQLD